MDVYLATEELAGLCNTARAGDRRWGDQAAKRIRLRLTQLRAADTLQDMRQFGGANPHELQGDRAGQLAVNGKGAMRIIFEPEHDPPPRKPDGGLDWSRVTAIRIVAIMDYH